MFQRIDSVLRPAALVLGLVPSAWGQEPATAPMKDSAQEGVETSDAEAAARKETVLEAVSEPLRIGLEDPETGEVTWKEIPPAAVRRALCYAAGKQMIESRRMDMFIAQEIERQVAAGADRSRFVAPDEVVDERMAASIEQLETDYPGQSPDEILGARLIDREGLRSMLEQTELFDRVFLPEDPRDYPPTTVQALQDQAGQEFIDQLVKGYEQRVAEGIEVDETDSGHQMWRNIMRQFVMKSLNANADVKTSADGIPPKHLLEVDGRAVETEEVWKELLAQGRLSPHDVHMTRLWLAKAEAVEAELRARGAWIPEKEFAEVWEDEQEPYKDSPFNLEVIAVGFRKFPSVDAYKRYFHLLKSYERLIEDEITDKALTAHIEGRANAMLGLGKVRADIIYLSAFEDYGVRFKMDGWEKAEERARQAAQELVDGADWDAVMDKYSDFRDMPYPESQQGNAPPPLKRGRFPLLHRNELVQKVGESDFWMFLTGYSVVDHVFFDQEVGTVGGPFKGVKGYYITKVIQRREPGKHLSVEDPSQRELVLQDYLAVRLNAFAQEVLAENQVVGL